MSGDSGNQRLPRALLAPPQDSGPAREDFAVIRSGIAGLLLTEAIGLDLAQIKADIAQIKADIAQIKADMVQVKADYAQVKADAGGVRLLGQDVSGGKADAKG